MGAAASCKQKSSNFPITGTLGLSESQQNDVKNFWEHLQNDSKSREFITDFLYNVMSKNDSLKSCFNLGSVQNDNLRQNLLFNRHVGNFVGVFQILFENMTRKIGAVDRKGRQLGARHRQI